ncbi:MAG: FAD-binding protein [Anaerolineae bacterium]|nr:FAD-binding protein [Anaerolineae bacterium]
MNHIAFIQALEKIVGKKYVVQDKAALMLYEADGCIMETHAPDVVIMPNSTEQVAAAIKLAREHGVPVTARGSGTGLSGGSTPVFGGLVITTTRMNRVLELDTRNNRVRVQPGVINFELSQYLMSYGYHFAADPSSQKACTIGGNIAMNSGGPHCVKYGVTGSHVLGLQLVLEDGSVMWTGDGTPDGIGYDLTGVNVGAAGGFGFVTEAWLRIMRVPESVRVVLALFPEIRPAAETVSEIISSGFLPTAMEMMDKWVIKAVNNAYKLGIPDEAKAALIIEVDGVDEGLDGLLAEIVGVCKKNGALEIRPAKTPEEQTQAWAARKNAFGAMGRVARSYYLVDTVVPRTKLPAVLDQVQKISEKYDLPVANVFHAGDGNLHPLVLYDRTRGDEDERAHKIATEVMQLCVAMGGVISGEHGVALEKKNYMPALYDTNDLGAMAALHECFNASKMFNPGKTFPDTCPPGALVAQRRRTFGDEAGAQSVVVGLAAALVNRAHAPHGHHDQQQALDSVVKQGAWV